MKILLKNTITFVKKHKIYTFVTIIILGICLFMVYTQTDIFRAETKVPEYIVSKDDKTPWWNENYKYRQKIQAQKIMPEATFKINHAQLVVDQKSKRDGFDLKVIDHLNGAGENLFFEIYGVDTTETYVHVSQVNQTAILYLYYGSRTEEEKTYTELTTADALELNSNLGAEQIPTILLTSPKFWFSKENDSTLIDLLWRSDLKDETVKGLFYSVDGSKIERIKNLKYKTLELALRNLSVGNHTIFMIAKTENDTVHRSNNVKFAVTAPVYIAWTTSWAGIDVSNSNLAVIENISKDYSIPITHFFNPRIFIHLKIPKWRKSELVDWLQGRKNNNGDEIALQLHMQHDLVQEAGVDPKDREQGWNNDVKGYDTPVTVYSKNELKQMLEWSLKQYDQNGLPKPLGFRAGGWFANNGLLNALEELRFLYDSSGIEPFKIGATDMEQDWSLDSTSQPYHPDKENHKGKGHMSIMEIPNNGGSTGWLSSEELIRNFFENYEKSKIPSESKIIVFTSHPEWINESEKDIRALFDELNKYRIEFDKGPVKFITLEGYLQANLTSF